MPRADFNMMVKREDEEAKAHAKGGNIDAEPGKEDDDENIVKANEDAREIPIKERVRNNLVSMYQHVLCFSPGAAAALHDDQGITSIDHIRELTDSLIDETCCVIQKPVVTRRNTRFPFLHVSASNCLPFGQSTCTGPDVSPKTSRIGCGTISDTS